MATTSKGHIERLPSGSLRVKVYAGRDPVTGRERVLRETCPDETEATAALARLLKHSSQLGSPCALSGGLRGQCLPASLGASDRGPALSRPAPLRHRPRAADRLAPAGEQVLGAPVRSTLRQQRAAPCYFTSSGE